MGKGGSSPTPPPGLGAFLGEQEVGGACINEGSLVGNGSQELLAMVWSEGGAGGVDQGLQPCVPPPRPLGRGTEPPGGGREWKRAVCRSRSGRVILDTREQPGSCSKYQRL